VTASALDLAFALTKGDIYIAGIDLENNDIRSHSRPYSLDRFMEEKTDRFNPFYSQVYKRSSTLKAGGSFKIYASWFEKQLKSYSRRLYPLGKNNSLFGSFSPETVNIALNTGGKNISPRYTEYLLRKYGSDLSNKIITIIEKALEKGDTELYGELKKLLFAGNNKNGEEPSHNELIETLHKILNRTTSNHSLLKGNDFE